MKTFIRVTMIDPSGDVEFYLNREHILGLQPVDNATLIHMPDRGVMKVRELVSYFNAYIY